MYNDKFHFTCTGGTFSDWFYHFFISPYCNIMMYTPIAVHIKCDDKSLQQTRDWCEKNAVILLICNDMLEIPLHTFFCDISLFYADPNCDLPNVTTFRSCFEPQELEVLKKHYQQHYQSLFLNSNKQDMMTAIDRDIDRFIDYIIYDKSDLLWDPKTPGPGPGFEFLHTDDMLKPDSLSDFTNRQYIKGAYDGLWVRSITGTIHTNPKCEDIGISINPAVPKIGLIPPRSRDQVKVVKSTDIMPSTFDTEAVKHFDSLDMNDNYHVAPICLKNEIDSLMKYCPHTDINQLATEYHPQDFQAMKFAYKRTAEDWNISKVSKQTVKEIVPKRNWKTSPGYPYNRLGANTGQEAYDCFPSHINEFLNKSRETWRPTVYNVFGKKEILKSTKGDDIRTIIGPCIAHQLMGQTLTMSISEHVGQNFKNSHTQIGRTRYKGDVDRTGKRISKFPIIEEYDISKWDRSIHASLLKMFCFYCWDVLDSNDMGDFYQLCNMFESTIYSFMSTRNGELFRKRYGVPSGFTLTSYANSWIHTFLQYYMFYTLCPYDNKENFGQDQWDAIIETHFDFVCYGDDGLMGMSEECAKWFTTEKRSKLLQDKFNISMPPEKCKMQTNFSIMEIGNDVDGIHFLGDVMHNLGGIIVPVFSINKVIGSIIHGSLGRQYSHLERIIIAYTHCVELRYHPRRYIVYDWLYYLYTTYKSMLTAEPATTREFEILQVGNFKPPDLIQHVCDYIQTKDYDRFDTFVDIMYYNDESGVPVNNSEYC